MSQAQKGALVLYKSSAALVNSIADKIEIITQNAGAKRVRDKDIELIFKGPVTDFEFLNKLPTANQDTLEEISELTQGENLNLAELAELIFGAVNAENIWAAYLILKDDIYFTGGFDGIKSRTLVEIKELIAQKEKKALQKQEETEFVKRLQTANLNQDDFKKITDIEELALGARDTSANLAKAGFKQDKPSAHKYLVKVGYWDKYFNPYPKRSGVITQREEIAVPEEFCIERVDLSHLESFAIDDDDSTDPDDAISLDGDKFWVHVADVAALVRPGTALDSYAREQPSNIYLPEKTVYMLPRAITDRFGLGLSSTSNALSVCFSIKDNKPVFQDLALSRIKVTRLSYAEVEEKLNQEPFKTMLEAAMRFKRQRLENGAVTLELPAVTLKAENNLVSAEKMELFTSRELVMEFMLMAGTVVGKKMQKANIPFIYSVQEPPAGEEPYQNSPKDYAGMIALRSRMQKSKAHTSPDRHAGLGLEVYAQITSPLRRYTDLCNHQQLHAYMEQTAYISQEQLDNKIAGYNEQSRKIRRVERESNLFWKIVYLSQNPDWQAEAVIIDNAAHKSRVLIPELALEAKLRIDKNNTLNQKLNLKLSSTDIYELDANFKICP